MNPIGAQSSSRAFCTIPSTFCACRWQASFFLNCTLSNLKLPPPLLQRLPQFRPYLGGAVWHGTATRLSDIYIQLFCDDSKSAEIALIEHNVDYEPRTVIGFTGASVEALSLSSLCKPLNETVGVHLLVYDHDDLRGALRPDNKGRTPRGDLAAVQKLLVVPVETPLEPEK